MQRYMLALAFSPCHATPSKVVDAPRPIDSMVDSPMVDAPDPVLLDMNLQVIWSTSINIGCAMLRCNLPLGYTIVCEYGPGGNDPDEKPY